MRGIIFLPSPCLLLCSDSEIVSHGGGDTDDDADDMSTTHDLVAGLHCRIEAWPFVVIVLVIGARRSVVGLVVVLVVVVLVVGARRCRR